jgi:SAM-dependent methyltransferase
MQSNEFTISYRVEELDQVNWNEEWEKNFEPIEVDGKCHVRAPFHPKTAAAYDIIIEPKMSFGTGHHETTHMMIQHLLETDVTNLKTLDMGCGTAILAILAEMKGAKPIDAIDIDNWCYLNSIENAARNACSNIEVFEGDASILVQEPKYDVVLANKKKFFYKKDLMFEGGKHYEIVSMEQYDELTNMTFDRVSKLSTRDILGTIRLWMFQPEESDWNLAVPENLLPIFQEIYHRNTILFLYYL